MSALRVGLSTCPNDTFAFHALLSGEVRVPGVELEFVLDDVEELNLRLLRGELDCTKASFHAMLAAAPQVRLLPCGAAIGFGVGPLLLAAAGRACGTPLAAGSRVLAPGRWTTANLLLRLLHDEPLRLEQTVFSDILPRLAAGDADYGACIHEARFTWREHGLQLVHDLGTLFEQRAGTALPLGGVCVSRSLDLGTARELGRALRRSLEWGLANREACLASMRQHAQEQSDAVLWAHVELYVNQWTLDLGRGGREALAGLLRLSRERGLPELDQELEILEL